MHRLHSCPNERADNFPAYYFNPTHWETDDDRPDGVPHSDTDANALDFERSIVAALVHAESMADGHESPDAAVQRSALRRRVRLWEWRRRIHGIRGLVR